MTAAADALSSPVRASGSRPSWRATVRGMTVEEILQEYAHLRPADVHDALYHRLELARISHQVSSREFVRAALARRDGRFDRKRVSYTLRIEPFVATQSSDAFTDSQQEAGEKCGLEAPPHPLTRQCVHRWIGVASLGRRRQGPAAEEVE